ncbi:sel1 repeat family protein [Rhizobium sp. TH2]|uniref:tetratricopeptide repeat protein n=1 Tax=Rhizobium sp. TH2 TaxID=2775403 RepID=UPI00215723E4|nr:hypothetical protein [Rhizobium sp. TH2]UVC06684.1 sel1 repeat family protein [Rhizobium sp. TH2]
MSHLVRFAALSLASAVSLSCLSPSAFAQTANDDAARKEREAREIAVAVEACDKGATAPLDFTAKAPPVQYIELFPADFDKAKLKALQEKCQQAWVGAPKEKRQHLQWLRTTMALGESNLQLLTPQVRKMAGDGSAEAQYLLYQLFRLNPDSTESSMMEISRDEAWTALNKAAEQGHMAAIQDMMIAYRGSSMAKRDLKQVVRWARRLEGAPPQGIEMTDYDVKSRARMPVMIAWTTLEEDGFSATENRMAFRIVEADMKSGGEDASWSTDVVVKSLRAGRGTRKDPVRAREILEEGAKTDKRMVPILADMLAKGEGGPEDGKRALEMVRAPDMKNNGAAMSVLGNILLSGKIVGYRPQEAIQALAKSYIAEDRVRLATLLLDYHPRLDRPEQLIDGLERQISAGDSEAAIALAKLKLSDNSQFSDEPGARALVKPLSDAGNREALWLYASTQYSNLGSTSYRPMRQEDGLSDAELMALIEDGINKGEAEAFLLKSKFLRAGALYPQDDRAATDMLIQAAERDNVRALLLLGDAYSDGKGVRKDSRKRLEAWRKAAKLGSLAAKKRITNAFTFDTFDRLMTLEEGITWRIALYNDGYDRRWDGLGIAPENAAEMEFMGLFMGRAMEAGTDAVAEAIMNAFREAPAGLDENNLVGLGKAFPPEIKVAIEKRLSRDGFLKGEPEGFWGPDVRKALADWVEGQAPVVQEASAEVSTETDQPAQETGGLLSKETVGRAWDKIRAQFNAAKNDRQKRAALGKVNTLAQYGNIDARWALLPNYHQSAMVRRVVSATEITRYGLDLMVTKPPQAEKVEFEFIFNTTQIYQDGKSREFGQAVIATIRDDKRIQDALTLGGLLKQFIFAPGACEAVLDAGNRAKIKGLGEEGCDDTTLAALVAYAKSAGPTGIDERNRKAAAEAIEEMLASR